MRVKKKLSGNSGFTLAETLLAMLILLVVTAIVANGMPVAQNAYEKVVLASNAQLLLSTTVTALKNELGTAWDVEASTDNKTIAYFNADTGSKSSISAPDKVIYRQVSVTLSDNVAFAELDDTKKNHATDIEPLVSEATTTKDLYVKYDTVTYADNVVTFTGLKVCRKTTDTVIAALDALKIRVVSRQA